MSFVNRYVAAGLVANPFSTQAIAESQVFIDRGISPPPPPYASTLVMVVGDSGFGKSTHLARWRRNHDCPYHYVPARPYRNRWAAPPTATDGVVYADEVDRMPRALRWKWFRSLARSEATVIIGTHVDLSRLGRRAGFREIRVSLLDPFDAETLRKLVAMRLAEQALGELNIDDWFSPDELEQVHARSNGVPRVAETICHGVIAQKVAAVEGSGKAVFT